MDSLKLKLIYYGGISGFIVLPILVYLIPFIVYQQPTKTRIGLNIYELTLIEIYLSALLIIVSLCLWVAVLLGFQKIIRYKDIEIKNIKIIYYVYSISGILTSIISSTFTLSINYENIIKLLSYLSICAIGIRFIFHHEISKLNIKERNIINLLFIINVVVYALYPLLLGYISNLFAFVTIFAFIIYLIDIKNYKQILTFIIILIIVSITLVFAQTIKNQYRQHMFSGNFKKIDLIEEDNKNKRLINSVNCTEPYELWNILPKSKDKLINIQEKLLIISQNRFKKYYNNSEDKLKKNINVTEFKNINDLLIARSLAIKNKIFMTYDKLFWENKIALLGFPKIIWSEDSDNKFNKTEVKMFLSEWKEDEELREVAISLIKNGIVWISNYDSDNLLNKSNLKISESLYYKINKETNYRYLLKKDNNSTIMVSKLHEIGIENLYNRDTTISLRLYAIGLQNNKSLGFEISELIRKGYGIDKNLSLGLECALYSKNEDAITPYIENNLDNQYIKNRLKNIIDKQFTNNIALLNKLNKNEKIQYEQFDVNIDNLPKVVKNIDYYINNGFARSLNRLNQFNNFSYFSNYSYKYAKIGYSIYYPIITFFIPRIIWQDKPKEISGLIVGKTIGLLNEGDSDFAWSMPVYVEAFIVNGFQAFIIANLALIATSLLILYLAFSQGRLGIASLLFSGVIALSQSVSSGLSATIGGTLQIILVLYVLNNIIIYTKIQ